ncbi:MAG: restriction endonuclease [Candidatus Kapabacteria bacterium]|nr:restriction endonuclease [Candidatus Kapabacteria bacterium]
MEHFKLKYKDLLNPTLIALKELGGSANSDEIEEKIIENLNLTNEQTNEIHKGSRTKLNYQLAWSKNNLKNYGLIENSSRGIWSLTEKGNETKTIDESLLLKSVFEKNIKKKYGFEKSNLLENEEINFDNSEINEIKWEDELLEIIKNITPDAFERLCQRLLRELGFIDVKVTGKVGDGGIDGSGIIKINGTLSFHVVFQAKRFAKSVSSSVIRDFRGAMVGRADKGLVMTTGTFTREAILEARRDGAPNIDLVDGVDFVKKLKYLKLGVEIEQIEKIHIKKEWFDNI